MTDLDKLSDRELDALFAEKVLGWTEVRVMVAFPPYTTSLDAAWAGVEKLNPPKSATRFVLHRWWADSSKWQAIMEVPAETSTALAECLAPHPARAVVLSCLRAVGADSA